MCTTFALLSVRVSVRVGVKVKVGRRVRVRLCVRVYCVIGFSRSLTQILITHHDHHRSAKLGYAYLIDS